MSASATITVALDWTPNTNHEGFFVALADGLYKDAGLEVVLRPPADAACNGLTPGRQVAAGIATFAVSPSETAVYVKILVLFSFPSMPVKFPLRFSVLFVYLGSMNRLMQYVLGRVCVCGTTWLWSTVFLNKLEFYQFDCRRLGSLAHC